jgi:hypothetical protein
LETAPVSVEDLKNSAFDTASPYIFAFDEADRGKNTLARGRLCGGVDMRHYRPLTKTALWGIVFTHRYGLAWYPPEAGMSEPSLRRIFNKSDSPLPGPGRPVRRRDPKED